MKIELTRSVKNNSELTYPFSVLPARAELVSVAPDVSWLRMPMTSYIDHVNTYLIKLDEGWLIIDTGLDSCESRATWEEIFSDTLRGESVVGVLCTHRHVDHAGLAGYLTERWHIPLFMSYEEYFSLRGWPECPTEIPWQYKQFYKRIGCPDDLFAKVMLMFDFSAHMSSYPPSFIRLLDGVPLPIGNDDWRILIGRGHSPEHAMIYSPRRGVLISGDQLLPRISTNVSVYAVNPEDEPLSQWFASLDRIAELPEGTLVLPGHGLPFIGLQSRVNELMGHHELNLQFIVDACSKQHHSVFDLVKTMYPSTLPDFSLLLAMGEFLAHIHYLLSRDHLEGSTDKYGVIRYQVKNAKLELLEGK